MINMIEKALASRATNTFRGGLGLFGITPWTDLPDGRLEMRWMGTRFGIGNTPGDIEKLGKYDSSLGEKFVSVGMVPLVGSSILGSENPFFESLILEASVEGSLIKHGYSKHNWGSEGNIYHMGRPPGSKLLKGGRLHGLVGGLDYMSRYSWGSFLAQTVAATLPGPIGTIGGIAAGSLAARYGGLKTTAAFIGFLGAREVARGTYNILKMGYSHRQKQKRLQTDGDMSAFMTQGAFTMRERAVQAIQKSHLNARSALGQEANYMHNPQRSYSSPYRRFY